MPMGARKPSTPHGLAAATVPAVRSGSGSAPNSMVPQLTDMGTLQNPAAQTALNLALRFLLGFHALRDKLTATKIEIAYAGSPLSSGSHAAIGGRRSITTGRRQVPAASHASCSTRPMLKRALPSQHGSRRSSNRSHGPRRICIVCSLSGLTATSAFLLAIPLGGKAERYLQRLVPAHA